MADFSPAGVAAGIVEGGYTSWAHQWTNAVPDGLFTDTDLLFFIDDSNDVLYLAWKDSAGNLRFGLYNLSDFSVVFQSSSGSDYLDCSPKNTYASFFLFGMAMEIEGGISRSLQTYVLIATDSHDIEVRRGGSSMLWARDIQNDTAGVWMEGCAISPTGKYIVVFVYDVGDYYIMLYKGS